MDRTAADVVVVGGGAAGATAVRTLVAEGFDGRVLLLAAEDAAPYDRTELSKAVLTGARDAPTALYPDDLADARVEVRTGVTATGLDLAARRVELTDGTQVDYGRLLLATGAAPRRPPLPGLDLAGVHEVRELATLPALRDAVARRGPLVVVGGGLIGLEVAAAARAHGTDVTVLEVADRLLPRVLPGPVAEVVAAEHASRGVRVELGVRAVALTDRGDGAVGGVTLADGRTLPADAVVVAVGVAPRTDLAAAAGLEVDDGIVVDRHLRTRDPHVLAAGDAARLRDADGRLRRRTEAWTPALAMGQHAARVLLGTDAPYGEVPWMWSDQYDLKVQAAGDAVDGLEPVVRGRADEPDGLAVFGLDADGRVRGVVGVSRGARIGRTVRAGQLLIASEVEVDRTDLSDPTVDLRRLARR